MARLAEPDLVAAPLRLEHQREGGVPGDLDAGQRIHHEEEFHCASIMNRRGSPRRCYDSHTARVGPEQLPRPVTLWSRPWWAKGARVRACASGSTVSTG